MSNKTFHSWPLRSRILSLAALPLILVTVVITLYHTASGIERETSSIRNNSERLLLQTANASELAIFAADIDTLNNTARHILSDSDIDAVYFFDDTRQPFPLASGGLPLTIAPEKLVHSQNYLRGNHWVFIKAVYSSPISFADTPETEINVAPTTGANNKPIGWLAIEVNLKSSQNRQIEIIRNNLLISAAILILALWLALLFSRSVTTPIRKITEAIDHYSRNDYSYRIDEISGAEIGQLEKGINRLAQKVGQSQQQLQDSITEVTDLWSGAVDDLRQKNIELKAATLEAEKANQAKDDFLARMSHELRTPLTAIMGFLGILEKSEDPQVRKEYIDMIAATSEVLLSTINDILDFSKLHSDGFELEVETFNLELLLQNILDMHALAAFKKGIELNLLIDSDVPLEIATDPDKLGKAVNNIVANAIKFTQDGDIVVFVSVAQQDEHSPLLCIEIKDSGEGIESEHLTQLFDPFYQVDNTTTRSHEGSGLGLAITRDFVNMLGGNIDAESELGQGTEIRFTLRAKVRSALQRHSHTPLKHAIIHETNHWSQRSWRNLLLKHTDKVTSITEPQALLQSLKQLPDNSMLLLGYSPNSHYPASHSPLDPDPARHNQIDTQSGLQLKLKDIRAQFHGPILVTANDHSELDRVSIQKDFGPLLITRKPLTANRLQKAITILSSGKADSNVPEKTSAASLSAATPAPQPLSGKSILVAEDNAFSLRLFNDLLSAAGAILTLTMDGEEAWHQATEKKFDLILLDKRMPRLDGVALSQRIRQQANPNNKTPVVLLTADRLDINILSHKDYKGVNALCYKPIEEQAFFSTLQRLLDLGTTTRSLINIDREKLQSEIETQLQTINSAADKSDMELLANHCHQLQGIMGMAGLGQLDDDLRYLTRALEHQDWRHILSGVEALLSSWSHHLATINNKN